MCRLQDLPREVQHPSVIVGDGKGANICVHVLTSVYRESMRVREQTGIESRRQATAKTPPENPHARRSSTEIQAGLGICPGTEDQ